MPKDTSAKFGIEVKISAELALRFVFANSNVDCALSGMSTLEVAELYCTGCKYCMPCP